MLNHKKLVLTLALLLVAVPAFSTPAGVLAHTLVGTFWFPDMRTARTVAPIVSRRICNGRLPAPVCAIQAQLIRYEAFEVAE